ncbi:MAG: type II toxin-antitoxin system RelE family toxin [Tepidiformaceae bacterium]
MRRVAWQDSVIDDILELLARDQRQLRRIIVAIRTYAREGRGDVRKLQGRPGEWRLRVGDWRVLFTLESEPDEHVSVAAIRLRRDAYD